VFLILFFRFFAAAFFSFRVSGIGSDSERHSDGYRNGEREGEENSETEREEEAGRIEREGEGEGEMRKEEGLWLLLLDSVVVLLVTMEVTSEYFAF
jgi:hypothetical protein